MSKHSFPHLNLKEYFDLVIGLIIDDLRIQKHLHNLGLSGLDVTPFKFELYERIFMLVGVSKKKNAQEIRDWYYDQADRVHDIDIDDEKALIELSAEIFDGLLKARQIPISRINPTS